IALASSAPTLTTFPLSTNLQPVSITTGPDGNVWFSEFPPPGVNSPGAIGRITPAGAVTQYPVRQGSDPFGLTTGSDGNLWFANLGSIARMTPTGVETDFTVPAPGGARAVTGQPVTTGPDGNVWFTFNASSSDWIGRVTPTGVISLFPIPYDSSSILTSITTGPDGNIWY